jgi:hypothetical protein
LVSISTDFSRTLLNRTPTKYRNDGTYLLWAITNNIYLNNIAFIETIQEKIYTATVTDHAHDIEKYLLYIKNNLKMITSTGSKHKQHNGLLTYILHQLHQTKNTIFQRYIQDMHIDYQEGKLPKYTPFKLIQECENKIRVLKHAKVWTTSSPLDTPAMALTTSSTLSDKLKEFLANQISNKLNKLDQSGKTPGKDGNQGKDGKTSHRFQHQEWLFVPPANQSDTKTINNRTYNWCAKCNRSQGQWVQAHTTATHIDNFIPPTCHSDPTCRGAQQKTAHVAQLQDPTDTKGKRVHSDPAIDPASDRVPTTAQLSLTDGLTNCFRFDVQDLVSGDN